MEGTPSYHPLKKKNIINQPFWSTTMYGKPPYVNSTRSWGKGSCS